MENQTQASPVELAKVKKKRRTLPEKEMALLEDLKRIQNMQAKALKDDLTDIADECARIVARMGLKPQTKNVQDAASLLLKAASEIKLDQPQ